MKKKMIVREEMRRTLEREKLMERDDAGPWKEHRRSTMSNGKKNEGWRL